MCKPRSTFPLFPINCTTTRFFTTKRSLSSETPAVACARVAATSELQLALS